MKWGRNKRKEYKNKERWGIGEMADNENNQITPNKTAYVITATTCRVNPNEVYVSGETGTKDREGDHYSKNK